MGSIVQICVGFCWWCCRRDPHQKTPGSQESQQRLISVAKGAIPAGNASLQSTRSLQNGIEPGQRQEGRPTNYNPIVLDAIKHPLLNHTLGKNRQSELHQAKSGDVDPDLTEEKNLQSIENS